MATTTENQTPSFWRILHADPLVLGATVIGWGLFVLMIPLFLLLHYTGARSGVSTFEVVAMTGIVALLPPVVTMPIAVRRTRQIRQVWRDSEEVPGTIRGVENWIGVALIVFVTFTYGKSEQIRKLYVLKREAFRPLLRAGEQVRVRVRRADPRRVLIADVFDRD